MWNSSLLPQWSQAVLIHLARTSELSGRRPLEIRMFLDKSSNPAQSFIVTWLQLVAWQRNPTIDHQHLEFSEMERTLLYHPYEIAPLEMKKKKSFVQVKSLSILCFFASSISRLISPLQVSFVTQQIRFISCHYLETARERNTLMDSFFFFISKPICCCRAVNQIAIILRNKLPITHYHNNDDKINYYCIKIRLQVMMEVCRFGCVPMGFYSWHDSAVCWTW